MNLIDKMKEFFFGKKEHPAKKQKHFIDCNFGHSVFNKTKRDKDYVKQINEEEEAAQFGVEEAHDRPHGNRGKKPKTTTTTTTFNPDTTTTSTSTTTTSPETTSTTTTTTEPETTSTTSTTTNLETTTTSTTSTTTNPSTTTTTTVPSTTTTTTRGNTTIKNVVLLDFDGHTVPVGNAWNYTSSPMIMAYSGLLDSEKAIILANCQEDYAAFNVLITTDEAVYNAAPLNSRMRCIITESWEWYGQAGGVAFVGSFTWGDNTPCFVFSSLLSYNTKYIKEAVSHEIGHTLGLYHQSKYDAACVKISDYNSGCCGEAPIMGVGYYQPDVHWWVGPNSYGCNNIQDDVAILQTKLGLK